MTKLVPLVLAALAACSSPPTSTTPWLLDVRILVTGPDVPAADCRTTVCRHNEQADLVVWSGALDTADLRRTR